MYTRQKLLLRAFRILLKEEYRPVSSRREVFGLRKLSLHSDSSRRKEMKPEHPIVFPPPRRRQHTISRVGFAAIILLVLVVVFAFTSGNVATCLKLLLTRPTGHPLASALSNDLLNSDQQPGISVGGKGMLTYKNNAMRTGQREAQMQAIVYSNSVRATGCTLSTPSRHSIRYV